MKVFRNLLDGIKPNFEKGGKLEKLYPAYDAFETFLFVPNHTTSTKCHVRDSIDLKRTFKEKVCIIGNCPYHISNKIFKTLNNIKAKTAPATISVKKCALTLTRLKATIEAKK